MTVISTESYAFASTVFVQTVYSVSSSGGLIVTSETVFCVIWWVGIRVFRWPAPLSWGVLLRFWAPPLSAYAATPIKIISKFNLPIPPLGINHSSFIPSVYQLPYTYPDLFGGFGLSGSMPDLVVGRILASGFDSCSGIPCFDPSFAALPQYNSI